MDTVSDPSEELVDRLISVAQKLADTPTPVEPPRRSRSRLFAVVGTGLLVCGAAVWFIGRDDASPSAFGGQSSVTTQSVSNGVTTDTAPAGSTDVAGTATSTTVTEAAANAPDTSVTATNDAAVTDTSTVTPSSSEVAPSAAPSSDEPIRYAEFSDGKVYLRGTVPDQATADEVAAKAGAVVGEANVIVEYDIVPGTPVPNDAPLYVRDSILFAPGSVTLSASAKSVLDLGVLLFSQNPQMTMVIEGHTDADGTAEENLRLSQARVDVILAYFIDSGVDPSKVTGVAKGESEPQASNDTAAGRALNRRVEAQIINLLG
jgi:outer membrane protein OmpA-like peptidoglycan-associated protein